MVAARTSGLVEAIRQVHEHCASQAGKAINVSLTLRNWVIGYYILEYEQRGGDRADYGERLLRNKCTLHMLMWFSATTDGEQLPEECSLITQRCLPIDDEPQSGDHAMLSSKYLSRSSQRPDRYLGKSP